MGRRVLPFVKLDCGILDSTLWIDREAREVFVTALLMGEPWEVEDPIPQLNVRSLEATGFVVPEGWYGFVHAAGTGIVRRSGLPAEAGLAALERLGAPDPESRSHDFDGRRLVRVDGGFVILNYMNYRERDYTTAERSRRYREKKALGSHAVTKPRHAVSSRVVTQAEEDGEGEAKENRSIPAALRASVDEIVAYYVSKRPLRKPGSKERRLIVALLQEGYDVAHFKQSIDGCTEHPTVNKETGEVYDSLELIVKDSAKLNQFHERGAKQMTAGDRWVTRKMKEMEEAERAKANGQV